MKTRRTIKRAVTNRIGIHEKTVANRMARAAGLSPEVLGELVEALETPDDIRAAIFQLAGRVAPPKKAVDSWLSPDLPAYRAYLDSIKRPSVLYGIGWRVVYCNKTYRELLSPGPHIPAFPGSMPLKNGVLYMLRHPNAARLLGAGSIKAYERHWCTLALAHFAAAYQENRDDPELQHTLREREKSPSLYASYESATKWIREHGDVAVSSEPRPFFDPRGEEHVTRAQVLTEAHPGSPLQHATWGIEGDVVDDGGGDGGDDEGDG
ncbi:hypothetical protein [Streptomyces rimosus]|uniref:hypothetical protein n=1 Tax=Streptomyces rimosus TaxID=1927 RepID=UPI000B1DA964|nr:hypothetical protein [Streptomyces rimosus]